MPRPAQRSGVITLTTDFGHKGPYTASMKGVMLSRFPEARLVDLTHETLVHWPAEAGFWLERTYRYFPAGTVHVAVVDPGVGTGRDIIAAEHDHHYFVAPDNGLLASLLSSGEGSSVYRLDLMKLVGFGIRDPSPSFQGRDIFAPLAAEIAAGRLEPSDFGPHVDVNDLIPAWVDEPEEIGKETRGLVITFDHFGNIITNIDASLLDRFERPVAHCGGHEFPVRTTYGDVQPGDDLALVNSFGVLELARAHGSAHDHLGVDRGAPVVVREA